MSCWVKQVMEIPQTLEIFHKESRTHDRERVNYSLGNFQREVMFVVCMMRGEMIETMLRKIMGRW